MYKIGLVHASNKNFSENQNYGLKFAPVWAFALSSYIDNLGSSCELYDLNVSDLNVIDECDFYFMSGINQDLETLTETAKYIKEKFAKKIFIGGPIAWSFNQAKELYKLDVYDHVCVGDGELLIPIIINGFAAGALSKTIIVEDRFDLTTSIPMNEAMINSSIDKYYGGVIEVSRGCPFLCEFCDIRVAPDNNRNRNKQFDVVLAEIDTYRKAGIRNIQLACDNFIGDPEWAKGMVDEIISYNKKHGYSPSFYTWLTINISNYPKLMQKMREAGFDNLFIGVESFDSNTLIETAKLQNTKVVISETVRNIQSYGFVVVAGLIFGFDSDTEDCFDNTLSGIVEAGLLSGDASLLTALPGTPLYRRMRLSGRLRKFNHESLLGGHKYVTNIIYLMPKDMLIAGYIRFSKSFLDGNYQYKRLARYYEIITTSTNYLTINRPGYTNVGEFLKQGIRRPTVLYFHLKRMVPLFGNFRFYYFVKALLLCLKWKIVRNIGTQYFVFWLFIWVNALNKYDEIVPADFDIDSVDVDFNISKILPDGYLEQADEKIPEVKIKAQYKATAAQLQRVIQLRSI